MERKINSNLNPFAPDQKKRFIEDSYIRPSCHVLDHNKQRFVEMKQAIEIYYKQINVCSRTECIAVQ